MRSSLALLFLSVTLGFTILQYGGVPAPQWNITLVAVCLVCFWVWLPGRTKDFAPPLPKAALIPAVALFVWIALQLLPLPADWLRVLSPNRFEILEGLRPIHAEFWAPLSIASRLTFAHLLRLFVYFLVFFLIRELSFRLGKRVWLAAVPLIVIAVAESAIGLAQHFAGGAVATGTYANHGHLAGLLEMTLPLTLALIPVALEKGRFEAGGVVTTAIVCLLIACASAILLGLVYTASRMGLAAAAISLALMGALGVFGRKPVRSPVAVISAFGGLVLLALSAPLILVNRYESGLTKEVRLQIWRDTLRLIPHYAVFGSGLGTFVSAVQKYRSTAPMQLVDYAHCDYLQLLAETGVIGFLIVMAIAFVLAKEMFRIMRSASGATRVIAIACLSSVTAIAVHSLVDFQFYIPANVMVAVWITGIAAGIGARQALKTR